MAYKRPVEGYPTWGRALCCGAVAGLAVDMTLYPLDTVKTRLMSHDGLLKSGGFRRLYAGLPSVAIGSAPGAALFFFTYETIKKKSSKQTLIRINFLLFPIFVWLSKNCLGKGWGVTWTTPIVHMFAASIGEIMACLFRVPTEVIKTRGQAFPNRSIKYIVLTAYETEGFKAFYRGFNSTVIREIPFSAIQFPLWEYFKHLSHSFINRNLVEGQKEVDISSLQGAGCGSLSGMISACVTTPLDVAKTRIMLTEKLHGRVEGLGVYSVLNDIYKIEGICGLFAGCLPRTIWMGLGGFIFFGAYEFAKRGYALSQAAVPSWSPKDEFGYDGKPPVTGPHFNDADNYEPGVINMDYDFQSPVKRWVAKNEEKYHRTFEQSLEATEFVREKNKKERQQEIVDRNRILQEKYDNWKKYKEEQGESV